MLTRKLLSRQTLLSRFCRFYSSNHDVSAPLLAHLTERGLISNSTSQDLDVKLLNDSKISLYCGADPTAPSLHLGNIVPLMVLLHFYIRGHNPITLIGGATGEVGDPSGRSTERQSMVDDVRQTNISNIQSQMKSFMENGWNYAKQKGYVNHGTVIPANNAEWWKGVTMLQFLGTYGRHIRVSQMLARESVKARLSSQDGIGFNEFTYQVLQAYDFWHLYKTHNCLVQVGGNDQWGNITAGIDLISRLKSSLGVQTPPDAHGLTVPLLTTPSGEKFGKSAGNAIWIDAKMTKPYELYQYFMKAPDSVVEQWLKLFTLIPLSDIPPIIKQHQENLELRHAQRVLACEVTDLIHGIGSGKQVDMISSILFPVEGQKASMKYPVADIISAFEKEGMLVTLPRGSVVGQPWRNVLSTLLDKSKSEAARMLKAGGVYCGLDRKPVNTPQVLDSDLEEDTLLLLRLGKSRYVVVQCT